MSSAGTASGCAAPFLRCLGAVSLTGAEGFLLLMALRIAAIIAKNNCRTANDGKAARSPMSLGRAVIPRLHDRRLRVGDDHTGAVVGLMQEAERIVLAEQRDVRR